jgi:hypothetical protein
MYEFESNTMQINGLYVKQIVPVGRLYSADNARCMI